MHDYDAALKTILKSLSPPVFRMLTGSDEVVRWREIDLPDIRNLRADLVGETTTGDLLHIELQSTNDPDMALRMLEYGLAIRRHLGRFPAQVVLYAGLAPMNMPAALDERELSFRFRVVDMRRIESEPLLASPGVADNVIAVLSRLPDQRAAVRRILDKIVESEPGKRDEAIRALEILAGLRRLGSFVKQETTSMPILDDILDHDYFGPKLREGIARGHEQGLERGLEQGLQQGREQGRLQGERSLVLRQIEKRFGPVPAWVTSRFDSMSAAEIEAVSLRLLDARRIEDLFSSN